MSFLASKDAITALGSNIDTCLESCRSCLDAAGLSWSGVDSAETLWVGLESFVFDWLINADRYSGLHDVVSRV